MDKQVKLELLNANNWLKICDLSVSKEQKAVFPIPNVYWIGISRYEEKSELFAIKADDEYIGLIGGGYDEDGITGYINPFMIDQLHQKNNYARPALRLIMKYLKETLKAEKININHRKENIVAGKIYDSLGFIIYNETDNEYQRQIDLTNFAM
ncbi:MAG: GNAT family N-acetyltransferase [Oscillospiraceae bacterium]|nr:GNAT family N-acetyltransferase [Oscillospiraceae bacterium]